MVAVDKSLRQMTGPQARQVFSEGRVLAPDEQRKTIKKVQESARKNVTRSGADPSKVKIEADLARGSVIVGGFRLKPQDFSTAFGALGFKIVRK